MKKILKSILIATASIGTIAGSTAAVVSCGEQAPGVDHTNQDKYDQALKSLQTKIGDGTGLGTFKIMEGGASIPAKLQKIESDIEASVNNLITSDSALNDVLGAATVVFPSNPFNTSASSDTVRTATGINVSIASDITNVTLPTPWGISVKYVVTSTNQENYDNAVKQILTTLDTLSAESRNTFLLSESEANIKKHLFDLINSAITDTTYISKFTSVAQITGLDNDARDIFAQFTKGEQSGKTEEIENIIFQPKQSGIITTPQKFTLHYSITTLAQKKYEAELAALLSLFTTTGTGSIAIQIENDSNQAAVEAAIKAQVGKVITDGGAVYGLLDANNIALTGITDGEFHFTPGDHSAAVNTLTTTVNIKIGTTLTSGVVPPAAGTTFNFYYIISPSTPDKEAYQTAINKIFQQYADGSRTINFIADTSTGEVWKNSVTATIQKDVSDYITLNTDLSAVINAGTAGANIAVDISTANFVNRVGSGSIKASPTLQITILPKWSGIPIVEKDFGFTYKVLPSNSFFTQGIADVQNHFNNADNKITLHRLGLEQTGLYTPDWYVLNAINNYISAMTDPNIKAAFASSVTIDPLPASISFLTLHQVDKTPTAITVTFNPSQAAIAAGITAQKITNFNIYWEVTPNINDNSAEKVLQQIISEVIDNSALPTRAVKLDLMQHADATAVSSAIKNLILNKMVQIPAAATWFNSTDDSVIVTGVTTTGTNPSINTDNVVADGVLDKTTTITVALTVNSAKSATTAVSPIALVGLHYQVYQDEQSIYLGEAQDVINGVQDGFAKLPLRLETTDNIDGIKTDIFNYINSFIDGLTPDQKTHIADLVNTNAIEAQISSFDLTTDSTTPKTSTGAIKITIPANTTKYPTLTTQALPIVVKYTVQTTDQTNYDQAAAAVHAYFRNHPLFTAPDGTKATDIPALIQTSIYNFISSTASDSVLTPVLKAAFKFSSPTDIEVTVGGTPSVSPGTKAFVTSDQVLVTIPAADGAIAAPVNYEGSEYIIQAETDQNNYNDAIAKITKAISNVKSDSPLFTWNVNPSFPGTKTPDGVTNRNYTHEELVAVLENEGPGGHEGYVQNFLETSSLGMYLAISGAQRLGIIDASKTTIAITGGPTDFGGTGPWSFTVSVTFTPLKSGVQAKAIDIATRVINQAPPAI